QAAAPVQAAPAQAAVATTASPYDSIGVNRILQFGSYEQDGDPSRKEPIEWVILKSEGSRKLLVSLYALDAAPFDAVTGQAPWSASSIRTWLNGEFYNTAFSALEQKGIAPTSLPAQANPWYPSVNVGQATQDNIFLLSVDEYVNDVLGLQGAPALMTQQQVRAALYERVQRAVKAIQLLSIAEPHLRAARQEQLRRADAASRHAQYHCAHFVHSRLPPYKEMKRSAPAYADPALLVDQSAKPSSAAKHNAMVMSRYMVTILVSGIPESSK
ncbi:MAG: hypothetical protein IJ074_04065, partial [Clostridia bacterium]|nr:hypothetical protein [Clostridia bacterium]